MIKEMLLEIMDFYRYKVENDKCTDADMREAFNLLSENVSSEATIKDIARHYGQSDSNVRNVLSRKYIGKPTRKVTYNFAGVSKVIPTSWKHGGK